MSGLNSALSMALPVLPQLVSLMSPGLRDSLAGELAALSRKAKETENPVDDVVLGVIGGLLGMDLPE